MKPAAKPYLNDIPLYVGGKQKAGVHKRVVKLSSNENPVGPSPKAIKAYQDAGVNLHRYPEDGCLSLREALGKHHGFPADQIICGTGSDEVLNMLVHAYAGPGDEVLFSEHGFAMYRIFTQAHGATPVAAPEQNLRADVDAMLKCVTDRTKLVFIANPNNPTGTYVTKAELHRLRAGLREDIILVLDGAYAEYMEQPDFTDGQELIAAGTNTFITRTFSKIYGLPALRLGWGYGPKSIIEMLYKIRPPFNVNSAAIAAGIAALEDTIYTEKLVALNKEQRAWVIQEITAMGLVAHPSFANFLLIEFPGKNSAAANTYLLDQGIIAREVGSYGLPDCLRVTIGTASDNQAFILALKEFLR